MTSGFLDALGADGPSPNRAGKMDDRPCGSLGRQRQELAPEFTARRK
jgi:hypothetical protein